MICTKCGARVFDVSFNGEWKIATFTKFPQPVGTPWVILIKAKCSYCGESLEVESMENFQELQDRMSSIMELKLNISKFLESQNENPYFKDKVE